MRPTARGLLGMLLTASAMSQAAPIACPAADAKIPDVSASHDGCNALDTYYKTLRSKRPDWQTVYRCAKQERDDAVLMMLYANGYGVRRDIDRAIAHACRVDGAVAETTPRIEHLQRIKAGQEKGPFDLCDDVTSGMMTGFCATVAEAAAGMERNDALVRLAARFTPGQRKQFAALRHATDAFAQASEAETDMSGTGRLAMVVEARATVQDGLLADLRAAEGGKLPAGTEVAFTAADKALNDTYRKVMALSTSGEGRIGYTTVTKDGIRTTQRSWIAYRDAWSAFAQARYPSVPAAAWKNRLTERRTAQLREWLE